MTKKLYLSIVLFTLLMPVMAQQYKANWAQIDKYDKVIDGFQNTLNIYPTFINDTDQFWYCFRTSEGVKYYIVDPAKKSQRELFDMDDVLAQMAVLKHKAYTCLDLRMCDLKFDSKATYFTFNVGSDAFKYDLRTKKVSLTKREREYFGDIPSGYVLSPDSLYYIYAYKHNLYVRGNIKKGMDTTAVQLTTDGTLEDSYYKRPDEAPESIGYPSGRWLKNSHVFLAEMMDMSKMDKMYLVDMLKEPRPKLVDYYYSCPGDKEVGDYYYELIDIKTKEIKRLDIQKWHDQYLEFSYDNTLDGSEIFFYRIKRTWDEKELCAYDLNTGKLRTIFSEVDKPFFDYVIAQTHYLNHAKEILFRSERTGFGHFYLYDGQTGKLKRTVTEGNFLTGQIIKIDTLRRDIYLYAHGKEKGVDPYYYMAYRVNMDKPGMTLLTPENANHTIYVSPSSKYIVDIYSRVDLPAKGVVRNNKGKEILKLEDVDIKPLLEKGWRFPERFCVKAADGLTDLYGVMWKPMDFDSTRKYPIISEVYPGPQYEYVPTSFCLESSLSSHLAQMGFIVIQVGHRGGTPLRGKAYHRYGYKRLRDFPLADDRAAIEELGRRYSFIDSKNAGMFGHSGGGFMSAAAICSSDFYKAAVACAGNHDNRIYNAGWIEMHNGVREKIIKNKENPADSICYKPERIQTNVEIAKNCQGHLMIVAGLMDSNVHPAHSFRLARALMDAGINFDMLTLPASTHGFVGPEDDYFLFKMRNHFAKYLLGDFSGEQILKFKDKEDR